MSRVRLMVVVPVLAAALVVAFPGCYTQFGTMGDEQSGSRETYDQNNNQEVSEAPPDSVSEGEYTEARHRFYFSNYYPVGLSFGLAYGDPWFGWGFGSWYGWGGYPYYPYSPWYNGYYGGGYNPWYGGWSYPGGYYPGYWYPNSRIYSTGTQRMIGANRSIGAMRGAGGGMTGFTRTGIGSFPAGRTSETPSRAGYRSPARSSTPAQSGKTSTGGSTVKRPERSSTTRGTPSSRPSGESRTGSVNRGGGEQRSSSPPPSREGNTRSGGNSRERTSRSSSSLEYRPYVPPIHYGESSPQRSEGGSRGYSAPSRSYTPPSSSSGTSYTPPSSSSSAPSHSSSPSSGGGGGGGSRTGGSRR
jgi:hypothetical protein